jgi:hypothetical protein
MFGGAPPKPCGRCRPPFAQRIKISLKLDYRSDIAESSRFDVLSTCTCPNQKPRVLRPDGGPGWFRVDGVIPKKIRSKFQAVKICLSYSDVSSPEIKKPPQCHHPALRLRLHIVRIRRQGLQH